MPVTVQVGNALRRKISVAKLVMAEGSNVREVIDDVESKYPGFKNEVVSEKGELIPHIIIALDDEDVRSLSGLDTKLEDGSTIAIYSAWGGG